MNLSINIKRVVITTVACFLGAILISTIEPFEKIPILFSQIIPLTNYDKIITKKKYQAFLLSALLMTILFFVSMMLGIFFSTFMGQFSVFVICILSAFLTLLSNSLFLEIENVNFGLIVVGLIAITIPLLTEFIKKHGLDYDPLTIFIVWQTMMGLGLSISIWTKKG